MQPYEDTLAMEVAPARGDFDLCYEAALHREEEAVCDLRPLPLELQTAALSIGKPACKGRSSPVELGFSLRATVHNHGRGQRGSQILSLHHDRLHRRFGVLLVRQNLPTQHEDALLQPRGVNPIGHRRIPAGYDHRDGSVGVGDGLPVIQAALMSPVVRGDSPDIRNRYSAVSGAPGLNGNDHGFVWDQTKVPEGIALGDQEAGFVARLAGLG
jgi:hypothetical protein